MEDCDSLARKGVIAEDFTEKNLLVGLCLSSKMLSAQTKLTILFVANKPEGLFGSFPSYLWGI